MNLAEKPHWDADSSVSSVLRRSPVSRISTPFLSKFITPSSRSRIHLNASASSRALSTRQRLPITLAPLPMTASLARSQNVHISVRYGVQAHAREVISLARMERPSRFVQPLPHRVLRFGGKGSQYG